jgi:hypothetical protein
MDRLARADFSFAMSNSFSITRQWASWFFGTWTTRTPDPELGKVLLELNAAADGQENIKLVLGDVRSAKAASGGTKRKRNSADLAAGSESVLREFLKSAKAASGGTKRKRNSADLAAGSESVLREFLKSSPFSFRSNKQ